MSIYKAHLFVCTNKPDTEGRCGFRGGDKLRDKLKSMTKTQPWAKQVRVNAAGCLGHCEQGIAAVMYPQDQWFFQATEQDAENLFKDLAAAVQDATEKSK